MLDTCSLLRISFKIPKHLLSVMIVVRCKYPPPPVQPEVLSDAGQCVALLYPYDLSKISPAVGASEGKVWGVTHHALQTVHTQAVSTWQLPRILEDVLTHWTCQHFLKVGFLCICHFWAQHLFKRVPVSIKTANRKELTAKYTQHSVAAFVNNILYCLFWA